MLENYHDSINKWLEIYDKVRFQFHVFDSDSAAHQWWEENAWCGCGFCREKNKKYGLLGCGKCPLYPRHCFNSFLERYSPRESCESHNNTMWKIYSALKIGDQEESLRLIRYFINSMRRCKKFFKED